MGERVKIYFKTKILTHVFFSEILKNQITALKIISMDNSYKKKKKIKFFFHIIFKISRFTFDYKADVNHFFLYCQT